MEGVLEWLFGWYNLPFLVSLGISMGFILIEAVTGGLSDMLPSSSGATLANGGSPSRCCCLTPAGFAAPKTSIG